VVSIAIRYGLESRLSKPGRVIFSGATQIDREIDPALYVVSNGSLFLG